MKQKSILIGCYATFILIGGLIGYFVANSLISLLASGSIALLLLICAMLIWKGNHKAYYAATAIVSCLLLFFAYRFFLTYKIAPAGIMTLISGGLVIYLITQRDPSRCCAKKEAS